MTLLAVLGERIKVLGRGARGVASAVFKIITQETGFAIIRLPPCTGLTSFVAFLAFLNWSASVDILVFLAFVAAFKLFCQYFFEEAGYAFILSFFAEIADWVAFIALLILRVFE